MLPRYKPVFQSIVLCLLTSTMSGCPGNPGLPLFDGYFSDGVTTVENRDSTGRLMWVDQPAPVINADGRFVAFEVRPGSGNEIYLRDRATGITERVDVASDGTPANSISYGPSLSADARLVAFYSFGRNLAPDDSNDNSDVFIRDRQVGTTIRVSNTTNGAAANGMSREPAISADGLYVAFLSSSSNLVTGDTNGKFDVFVHDVQTQLTTRVNLSSAGDQDNKGSQVNVPPGISADGRYIAFDTLGSNLVADDTNGEEDVFVHDRVTRQTVRVSISSLGDQGEGRSHSPQISADGRLVAFISSAKNLAPGNEYSEASTTVVYVHDRDADGNGIFDESCDACRRTERLPLEPPDLPDEGIVLGLALSGDGNTVAYVRTLTNPATTSPAAPSAWDATVWIHDRTNGTTRRVTADRPGMRFEGDSLGFVPVTRQVANNSERPNLSHDGRFVAYGGRLLATYAGAPEAVFVEDLRP